MKTTMSILAFSFLTVSATGLQAQNTYSNASFQGEYVLAELGNSSGGTVTVLGKIKADGNGFLTGTVYQRLPGRVASAAAAEGQYAINQDGTGTMKIRFNMSDSDSVVVDPGVLRWYDLVLTQNGATARGDGDGVPSSVDIRLPAATPCSIAALKGVYGFSESGILNATTPLPTVGQFRFDGIGGVRGTISVPTTDGTAPQTITFDGNYTTETSGTGQIAIQYSVAPADTSDDSQIKQSRFLFIYTADGGLKGMRLDPNYSTIADFRQQ